MPALEAVATRALVEEIRRRLESGNAAFTVYPPEKFAVGGASSWEWGKGYVKVGGAAPVVLESLDVTPPAEPKPETFGSRARLLFSGIEEDRLLRDMADALDRLTDIRIVGDGTITSNEGITL